VLDHNRLNGLCANIARTTLPGVLTQVRDPLIAMQEHAAQFAGRELPGLVEQAQVSLTQHLSNEIDRLRALRAVNPSIREEEIEFFAAQLEAGRTALAAATVQLQALRVIINT
jgi:ATP-dependent helicase HepA